MVASISTSCCKRGWPSRGGFHQHLSASMVDLKTCGSGEWGRRARFGLILGFLVLVFVSSTTEGFVPASTLRSTCSVTASTTSNLRTFQQQKHNSALHLTILSHDILQGAATRSSFWLSLMEDSTEDETTTAFSDSIDYMDGTIQLMLGAFGVVIVVLAGLKFLSDQMDSAISQVLVDFESTMKVYFAQQWQDEILPQLAGLEGDARQAKLVQIMETMEQNNPSLMERVQAKMKQ